MSISLEKVAEKYLVAKKLILDNDGSRWVSPNVPKLARCFKLTGKTARSPGICARSGSYSQSSEDSISTLLSRKPADPGPIRARIPIANWLAFDEGTENIPAKGFLPEESATL